MANFNAHLNTAVVTTGLGAAVLLSAEHIELTTALWLWFLGIIGGLLPDIDSDNSTSLDTIFNLLALSAVLFIVNYITGSQFTKISFLELMVIPLVAYYMMTLIVRPIFERVTVHRGSCHSILFLTFIALLTTQIIWRLNILNTEQLELTAWLSGGFIFFGGMVHLVLDEISSVDLQSVKIKRSFGSALKLADFKNKSLTLFTLIMIFVLAYQAPPTAGTISTLSNWTELNILGSTLLYQI